MKQEKNTLPAGLMDHNIEFFANDVGVYALYGSAIIAIRDLPAHILSIIRNDVFKNKAAIKAISEMGITEDDVIIWQYVRCNYGGFDMHPDVKDNKLQQSEYWDCGYRGICKHEGKLCQSIKVANGYLTPREIGVIKLISSGLLDKEIADKLKISINTVTSHKENIQEKTGLQTKVEIAVFAITKNIIQ